MPQRRNMPSQRYVYGNAAPAQEAPQRRSRSARRRAVSLKQRRVRRMKQERAFRIDLPFLGVLSAATVILLWTCVGYLHVHSSIRGRIHNIGRLERQLEDIRTENDVFEARINNSVSIERVYEIATEELGMAYPDDGRILEYQRGEKEYVRQQDEVPAD